MRPRPTNAAATARPKSRPTETATGAAERATPGSSSRAARGAYDGGSGVGEAPSRGASGWDGWTGCGTTVALTPRCRPRPPRRVGPAARPARRPVLLGTERWSARGMSAARAGARASADLPAPRAERDELEPRRARLELDGRPVRAREHEGRVDGLLGPRHGYLPGAARDHTVPLAGEQRLGHGHPGGVLDTGVLQGRREEHDVGRREPHLVGRHVRGVALAAHPAPIAAVPLPHRAAREREPL